MKHTCIIVDDEPLARNVIKEFVAQMPDYDLIGEYGNSLAAHSFLNANKVDVLFLDINMPGLSGIQLMKSLQYAPLVVFTTAYSEYAVEAFELEAFDYLVKPISFERFVTCISKVSKKLNTSTSEISTTTWISIKEGKRIYKIELNDIYFLEAYGDYVKVHAADKVYVTKDKMQNMLSNLPDHFLQVHRSYIVNSDQVKYIEGNHVMLLDKIVPVSSTFKEELLKRFS